MSLQRLVLTKTELPPNGELKLEAAPRAIWVESGDLQANGMLLGTHSGAFCSGSCTFQSSAAATVLRFEVLQADQAENGEVLLDEAIEFDPAASLLRLDTVTFPPGATAYRHIHNGTGHRYLYTGVLEVVSDHGAEVMETGSAWYEPLNSPVTANASNEITTAFVRCMIVPSSYEGKSTFKLMDPADGEKPRRQVTHRFFDAPL